MKSVKIPDAEYVAIKHLAAKQGRLLQAVLADALRHYVGLQKTMRRLNGKEEHEQTRTTNGR